MNPEVNGNTHPAFRVVRSEAIIFTEFEDATVMMDAEVGRYYEINAVGARVWALAESGPQVAEVCEALAAEYEVAPDRCRDEVVAFLNEMHRREVVRVLPVNGANETANEDKGDPEASPTSGRAAVPQSDGPRAKIAWTTPLIRVMPVERTGSGEAGPHGTYNEQTVGSFFSDYSVPS